jgi:putative ABC transport system permease protein
MDVIAGQLAREFPENAGMGAEVVPLETELVGDTQKSLLVLLAAVGFVLLIACVNVANLMLARAARRQREMAVRAAIGARRARVMRQLLTEALLLSSLAAIAGVLLAYAAFAGIRAMLPSTLPRFNPIAIDANVLLFACGVAIVTALLFGVAPALHSASNDITSQLKEAGTSVTLDRKGKRIRALLMVGELALAALLLVCSALTVKSLQRLLGVNPGFDARNVLTFFVPLYGSEYGSTAKAVQSHNQIVARLRAVPGIEAVAYSTDLPLGFGGGWGKLVSFPGRPAPASRADVPDVAFQLISADYFRAIGTPIDQGRAFTDSDDAHGQQVAIVNEAFAHKFFGDQNPVGKTLLMDAPPGIASTHGSGEDPAPIRLIVGVAADIKDDRGLGAPAGPRVFVPIGQFKGEGGFRTGLYCARIHGDIAAVLPAIRNAVHEFDSQVPLVRVRTLDELVGTSASAQRFIALLLGSFAGLALLMAAIGAYGVISNVVAYRTREIGVRVALGASPRGVVRLVMSDAVRVALVGTAVGLVLGAIATRALRSMLFEVRATDPTAFVTVGAGLIVTALLASYIPARRATKVDPLTALRAE